LGLYKKGVKKRFPPNNKRPPPPIKGFSLEKIINPRKILNPKTRRKKVKKMPQP